jgi:hypothetical protein
MRIILGMIWRVILTFKVERRGEGGDDDKELSAAQSTRSFLLSYFHFLYSRCLKTTTSGGGRIYPGFYSLHFL